MPGRPGAAAAGQQQAQQQAGKAGDTKAAAILHGSVFVAGKLEIQFDGIGAVITAVAVMRGNVLDQMDAQAADGPLLCGQRRIRRGGLHKRIEGRAPVPYPDAEEGRAVHAHPLEAQFHLSPVGVPVAFLRAGTGIGVGGHIDQQFLHCQLHETEDPGMVGGQVFTQEFHGRRAAVNTGGKHDSGHCLPPCPVSAGQGRQGFLPTVTDGQHGVEPGDAEHFRRHGLQGAEGQLSGAGLERLDQPQDAPQAGRADVFQPGHVDEQALLPRLQQGAGRVVEFRCRRGVHAACELHDGDTVLFRYDDFHRTSESGYW